MVEVTTMQENVRGGAGGGNMSVEAERAEVTSVVVAAMYVGKS